VGGSIEGPRGYSSLAGTNSNKVVVIGWIIKTTESKKAAIFLWEGRSYNHETVILPWSQIEVVTGEFHDEVTMPEWLAKDKGFV
jgi:hypothetical protein